MKRIHWIMAAVFAAMSVTAFAQTAQPEAPGHAPHERIGKRHGVKWADRIKQYETQLQLSPQQVSEWQALHEANKQEWKTFKANTSISQEEKKAHRKTVHQRNQTALKKILSQEQYTQYRELRKENKQARKAPHRLKRENVKQKQEIRK